MWWDHSGGQCGSGPPFSPSVHPFNLLSTCLGWVLFYVLEIQQGRNVDEKTCSCWRFTSSWSSWALPLPTLG